MPKLNDTQLILLSTASQRADCSLYPLPETLTAGARVEKAISNLVLKNLVAERETTDPAAVYRTDGDIRYGLFATDASLTPLHIGDAVDTPPVSSSSPRQTKTATVIALLERDDGATLAELTAATDWLPHTTRAALTGLRKKGHTVERVKRGDDSCYRIVKAAA